MFRHRPWQNAGGDFVYASTGGSRPLHPFLGTNDRCPPPSVIANQCAHWCGNPFSLLPWYFLSPAKESTQRTPPKPRFWNPSAYRHAINENLYLAQSACANLSLLSHAPCVYHRCPLLQWNRDARRDNRGSHCYASVGEDNSVRPTVTK